LIPKYGTDKILIILSITLILVSLSLTIQKGTKIKLSVLTVMIISWFVFGTLNSNMKKNGFIDVDTTYNRIWIYNSFDKKTMEAIRTFSINNENSSAMFLNKTDLVYDYTKFYHLARHFNPDFKTTLMLGGAGYSYPKDFLLQYPEATIDVVEIDPKVTELAKQYFNLSDNSRLTIFHEDGRIYLNKTSKKYDVIFGDAFSSHYSLPYQLTTKEAVQKEFDILNDNGVVIVNIISSIEGESGQFLRAEYATYKCIFPQVFLFPVKDVNDSKKVQNIILIALKTNQEQKFSNTNPILNKYLQHLWKTPVNIDMPILTDDYAPVDFYISKTI
jgi:spermidine synthase